jgi:hypothetical protein
VPFVIPEPAVGRAHSFRGDANPFSTVADIDIIGTPVSVSVSTHHCGDMSPASGADVDIIGTPVPVPTLAAPTAQTPTTYFRVQTPAESGRANNSGE